jgi:peroxiredoxin
MEGETTCPICAERVVEGDIKGHMEQMHPAGSSAGNSAGEGNREKVHGEGTGPEEASRKRGWIVLLVLTLVIIIILATISILMVPKAVKNPLDFSLPDTSGSDWNLGNHIREGKPILIEFIALDCNPCISWAQSPGGSLRELYGNYGSEIEFVTVVTSLEGVGHITPTPELVREFKEQYGTPWTYLVDNGTTVRNLYGVVALPTVFVIDRNGYVAWTHTGIVDYATLEAAVRLVL